MPNCKFCGKPVKSTRVMHAHCWEQKVMELMETVCDSYCRWPLECRSSEELEENHCKTENIYAGSCVKKQNRYGAPRWMGSVRCSMCDCFAVKSEWNTL